jgi:hypothetical protein
VPETYDFTLTNDDTPSVTVLGAGRKVDSNCEMTSRDVSKGEFDAAVMHSSITRIHHYGTVTYRDVFEERQWTNFCFALDWSATGVSARTTPYHNDAS